MKRVLRSIYCGISGKLKEDGSYAFSVDFNQNADDDVVSFLEPYFYTSEIDDNTYWFGYKFAQAARNKEYRDACIEYLKNVQWRGEVEDEEIDEFEYDPDKLSGEELDRMIRRSLNSIDINTYNIDTIIYPLSSSNNLVRSIVSCIMGILRNSNRLKFVEVQKADPCDIAIDIERCLEDKSIGKLTDKLDIIDRPYLESLVDKIHRLSTFSLRRDVSPMSLRPYVSNFLEIKDVAAKVETSDNILIVDDFKTSGTTISEIINIVRKYNPDTNIYIFTLLGKADKKQAI